jgi:hypothetical protein
MLPTPTLLSISKHENWEIIADNLSKAGWSWGCISSTDHEGRQFWVAIGGGVYVDEKLAQAEGLVMMSGSESG